MALQFNGPIGHHILKFDLKFCSPTLFFGIGHSDWLSIYQCHAANT